MEILVTHQAIQNLVNIVKINSKSQFNQDIFVLNNLEFKENGFFVEFGATNGVDLSNTHILEKLFSWNGIVAEPSKFWHKSLLMNRNCFVDFRCVSKNSGQLITFNQSVNPDLSAASGYGNDDFNANERNIFVDSYQVISVTLSDLLKQYKAPYEIDYLSIDTEGSEYDILSSFNFNEYNIKIITCEHNFTENREKIYNLLIKNKYVRVLEQISGVDDWYIRK